MSNFTEHTEFEVKHLVDYDHLSFKRMMTEIGFDKYIYAEGGDYFFSQPGKDKWIRFRESELEDLNWLTVKQQMGDGVINRQEADLVLDMNINKRSEVFEFLKQIGFEHDYTVYKECYIYYINRVTVVYYRSFRIDKPSSVMNFVEIEIDKNVIPILGYNAAVGLIRDYQNMLGLDPRTRMRRSLRDIFKGE